MRLRIPAIARWTTGRILLLWDGHVLIGEGVAYSEDGEPKFVQDNEPYAGLIVETERPAGWRPLPTPGPVVRPSSGVRKGRVPSARP